MYVMTWGDFCLMSRGRGEKSNNKTSRGSFDLGRLRPPGPVGGSRDVVKHQPARCWMRPPTANPPTGSHPMPRDALLGRTGDYRKKDQDVQYATVVQRQTLDHRIRRFRWRRPRDRGLQWWWLIHNDEGCPWRG